MFNKTGLAFSLIAGLTYSPALLAEPANTGPVGYWKTFDLEKTPRSIVRIIEKNDMLSAKVVKVITNKQPNAEPFCVKCEGELKNKPLIGLRIIWNVKKEKDEDKWSEGHIVDADSGKTYRCNISTSADGKILYLHAYAGAPLFGKTIEWQRVSKKDATS